MLLERIYAYLGKVIIEDIIKNMEEWDDGIGYGYGCDSKYLFVFVCVYGEG